MSEEPETFEELLERGLGWCDDAYLHMGGLFILIVRMSEGFYVCKAMEAQTTKYRFEVSSIVEAKYCAIGALYENLLENKHHAKT